MKFPVMYSPELLREIYAHMEWADARIWSEVLGTARADGDEWLGQVMTRLRELGGAPPLVDYVIWVWSGSPVADWDTLP